MNAVLAPVRSLDLDERSALEAVTAGAHPSIADRLSLRIGLWLLLRGERRIARRRDHDIHELERRNALERESRESAATRAASHSYVR
jgi:hypothetical protein